MHQRYVKRDLYISQKKNTKTQQGPFSWRIAAGTRRPRELAILGGCRCVPTSDRAPVRRYVGMYVCVCVCVCVCACV